MLQTLILNNEYCDEYAVVAFAVPVDVLEFSAISQIITHAEERSILVVRRSEPLSSFGAAPLQHQASILGRHARTEPVLALAAADIRLVRALHGGAEPFAGVGSAAAAAAKRGV